MFYRPEHLTNNCPAATLWATKLSITGGSATANVSFSDGDNDYSLDGTVNFQPHPANSSVYQGLCGGSLYRQDNASDPDFVAPKMLYRPFWYGWQRFIVTGLYGQVNGSGVNGSVSGPVAQYVSASSTNTSGEAVVAGLFKPWDSTDPWYECANKIWNSSAKSPWLSSCTFTFTVALEPVSDPPTDEDGYPIPYTGMFMGRDCSQYYDPYGYGGGCLDGAFIAVSGTLDRIEPGATITYRGPDDEIIGTGELNYTLDPG